MSRSQAWGNTSPRLSGEQSGLQTGIGRPVDAEWAESFEMAFRHLAPSEFTLSMRRVPGVVYVSPKDYAAGKSDEEYRGEESEIEAFAEIQRHIEAMCVKGILKANAREAVEVMQYRTIDARHRKGIIYASAMVNDIATEDYPFGFLLTGERMAINHYLDSRARYQQVSMKETPALQLGLGNIHSSEGPVPRSLMLEVNEMMAQTIQLEPVGPIRFRY
jgi:hypothetical protein